MKFSERLCYAIGAIYLSLMVLIAATLWLTLGFLAAERFLTVAIFLATVLGLVAARCALSFESKNGF